MRSDEFIRSLEHLHEGMLRTLHSTSANSYYGDEYKLAAGALRRILLKEKSSMLLYPDMSKDTYEGSDYFCFSAPCTKAEWDNMYSQRISQDQSEHYLPFLVMKDEAAEEEVCVVLRFPHTTDEQAVTTAAWIRTAKEFTGMIYAVGHDNAYGDMQSLSSIIARTAGCSPAQVRHLDLIPNEKE